MTMNQDFDTPKPLEDFSLKKWHNIEGKIIPFSVADMDFPVAESIQARIKLRCDQAVLGYPIYPPEYFQAEIDWWQKRHSCKIENEWIVPCNGIKPGISAFLAEITDPGDQILVQAPVYEHFAKAVKDVSCELISSDLVLENNRYHIDFEDFEQKAWKAKVFLLCNPHNPLGRVWSYPEIEKLGTICQKYGLIVLADEAHRDLVFPGKSHIPFISINPDYGNFTVTTTSPGKTFNLSGLRVAI
jgi:cystathionine beta-lyase